MSSSMSVTRRLRRAPLALGLTSLAMLASCDDDPTGGAADTCRGNVTVSVSPGTTPTFTWSPACRAASLLVETQAEGDVWRIESSGSDGIASGVTYGTVPPGAVEDAPATPLVEGSRYDVILFRGSGAGVAIAGVASFIP